MEISVLGSGSAGNCTLVKARSSALLIDAGLSAKQTEQRLKSMGLGLADLDGILVTHEHKDHTAGLPVLLRKHTIPVYCNSGTARVLRSSAAYSQAPFRLFETGSHFSMADFRVLPFPVPHDAEDPVGFRIEEGGSAVGLLSDLGYVTHLAAESVRGVSALIIEANYDEALLQNDTKRPWSVKQRIASRHGHLSNLAAAQTLRSLAEGLAHVILCHLSRDCNTRELAASAISGCLGRSTSLEVSSQETPTAPVSC